MNWDRLAEVISQAVGHPFQILQLGPVGGGCINEAFRLQGKQKSFFVKINRASWQEMFTAEAAGLEELHRAKALRVPKPIYHGAQSDKAFLVLEYLSLQPLNASEQKVLGRQLARLHRHTAKLFGWGRDNTIGSTPQPNAQLADWAEFFSRHRLKFQFKLAAKNGFNVSGADRLCDGLGDFFQDYQPVPSLLHGDLWGGNVAMTEDGSPVIFDPACYYGDREVDLAFTEMFGGFSEDFYQAYRQEWPLDAGYQIRKELYNLYHLLNHYNLFGGGYGRQAQLTTELLLAEI